MAVSQSEIRLLQRKANKYDEMVERIKTYHEVWSALDNLVNAWEYLPGGQNHSPRDVERWLSNSMSPAINRARRILGRKAPNE